MPEDCFSIPQCQQVERHHPQQEDHIDGHVDEIVPIEDNNHRNGRDPRSGRRLSRGAFSDGPADTYENPQALPLRRHSITE